MQPLRNLSVTPELLAYHLDSADTSVSFALARYAENPAEPHNQYSLLTIPLSQQKCLLMRYGRGDSLASLRAYFLDELLPTTRRAQALAKQHFPEHQVRLNSSEPWAILWLFAFACFDDDGKELARAADWFDQDGDVLFDMLLKAFAPATAYLEKYDATASDDIDEPIIDALLLPEPARTEALAAYMRKWPKTMKKYGYRDAPNDRITIFLHFPFVLALAVCAYDIDDAAFRDLPYYPRELVDYYRDHVRHQRDAWRAAGVGPGPEVPAAFHLQPKKVYALKAPQAYARWLELACNEDADTLARAHKALKKRKSMPALFNAMEALAGLGCAVQADIKDDETLAAQVDAMCAARALAPFTAPSEPPQGPARISAILSALHGWAIGQGQHLFVMSDNEDDNWNAVLVRAGASDEFALLCEQLSLDVLDQARWN